MRDWIDDVAILIQDTLFVFSSNDECRGRFSQFTMGGQVIYYISCGRYESRESHFPLGIDMQVPLGVCRYTVTLTMIMDPFSS